MNKEKKWSVYVHIVPIEVSGYLHNKYYVGITSKNNCEKRWEHGYGYRYNKHFFKAICKYGWDNIIHQIIATSLSQQEACDMEKLFIALYNSSNPKYGYNKTYGGEGVVGIKMNPKEKERRSLAFKGEKNPFYGKKHSDSTRKIMSDKHYECSGDKNPRARKMYQFSLNYKFIRVFSTVTEAAKEYGTFDSNINNAARKKCTAKGFFWAYEEEIVKKDGTCYLKLQDEYIVPKRGKTVAQYDAHDNLIEIYESTADAQNKTGIVKQNIGKVARRGYGLAGGFKWRYVEDGNNCSCVNC